MQGWRVSTLPKLTQLSGQEGPSDMQGDVREPVHLRVPHGHVHTERGSLSQPQDATGHTAGCPPTSLEAEAPAVVRFPHPAGPGWHPGPPPPSGTEGWFQGVRGGRWGGEQSHLHRVFQLGL